ncbi:MAG: hypothetical protein DRI61_11570 [Chloroflexi bacterium]|nr:MAG: hypothetical protein DRI61_11570 [Chloroflexota bacterium]
MARFIRFKKPTRKQLLERIVLLEEEIGKVKAEMMKTMERELDTRVAQLQDLLAEITALVALLESKGLVAQEEINEWLRRRRDG